MKALLLKQLVSLIIGLATPELLELLAKAMVKFVIKFVKGTKTDIDDALVLPICDILINKYEWDDITTDDPIEDAS